MTAKALLVAQALLCFVCFVLSLFIFVPVVINTKQAHGHCLLFADGSWDKQLASLTVFWGDGRLCSYPVIVGAICFPLSLLLGVQSFVNIYKSSSPSWSASFLRLGVCSITTVLLLVAGIFLSAGLKHWCRLVKNKYHSCSVQESLTINTKEELSTEGFYTQMVVAQFGVWASWLCWMVLSGCSSYHVFEFQRTAGFKLISENERLVQAEPAFL